MRGNESAMSVTPLQDHSTAWRFKTALFPFTCRRRITVFKRFRVCCNGAQHAQSMIQRCRRAISLNPFKPLSCVEFCQTAVRPGAAGLITVNMTTLKSLTGLNGSNNSAPADGDAKRAKTVQSPGKQDFLRVFDTLKTELVNDPLIAGQPEFAQKWLQRMLEFNVPGGKLNRGMAVLDVLKALQGTENVGDDKAFKANVLGWCIELLQAFFLVSDDLMDNSVTRRGQPCWYRMPEVGTIAINDGIILESCIYRVLRSHFKSTAYYTDLLDLFHETTHQTAHGQLLDLTTSPAGSQDLSKFTISNYMRIVTFKTAYYSFYLPVACGMLLSGITKPEAFQTAKDILLVMGQYFQIQDDYLDCFGDPDVIGKIGTDIQDNKCGWLVVQALQKASSSQQQTIKDNYGRGNAEAVQRVKALYRELNLEQTFREYEANSHAELLDAIHKQEVLPPAVFTMLLNKIYKRTK